MNNYQKIKSNETEEYKAFEISDLFQQKKEIKITHEKNFSQGVSSQLTASQPASVWLRVPDSIAIHKQKLQEKRFLQLEQQLGDSQETFISGSQTLSTNFIQVNPSKQLSIHRNSLKPKVRFDPDVLYIQEPNQDQISDNIEKQSNLDESSNQVEDFENINQNLCFDKDPLNKNLQAYLNECQNDRNKYFELEIQKASQNLQEQTKFGNSKRIINFLIRTPREQKQKIISKLNNSQNSLQAQMIKNSSNENITSQNSFQIEIFAKQFFNSNLKELSQPQDIQNPNSPKDDILQEEAHQELQNGIEKSFENSQNSKISEKTFHSYLTNDSKASCLFITQLYRKMKQSCIEKRLSDSQIDDEFYDYRLSSKFQDDSRASNTQDNKLQYDDRLFEIGKKRSKLSIHKAVYQRDFNQEEHFANLIQQNGNQKFGQKVTENLNFNYDEDSSDFNQNTPQKIKNIQKKGIRNYISGPQLISQMIDDNQLKVLLHTSLSYRSFWQNERQNKSNQKHINQFELFQNPEELIINQKQSFQKLSVMAKDSEKQEYCKFKLFTDKQIGLSNLEYLTDSQVVVQCNQDEDYMTDDDVLSKTKKICKNDLIDIYRCIVDNQRETEKSTFNYRKQKMFGNAQNLRSLDLKIQNNEKNPGQSKELNIAKNSFKEDVHVSFSQAITDTQSEISFEV